MALIPIFAHKVKQVLISANDSLNYDNLTHDNIFNTTASMCNNKKLLTYQLQIKKANFCKQNGLPPIRQKEKKHDKNRSEERRVGKEC